MVQEYEISEIATPKGLEPFFNGKPPKLWSVGNPAILERKLLGIISARQVDSDLAPESSHLLKEFAEQRKFAFIGGWHSLAEEASFQILLAQAATIVFCAAKALDKVVLPPDVEGRVNQGQILLLTHCSPKAKRISREASIRRNELVTGLATALLVLSAPPGSASLDIAKSALRRGKPVFTPRLHINNDLLACGALPATLETVRAALV